MGLSIFNFGSAVLFTFEFQQFFWPGSNPEVTIGVFGILIEVPIIIVYSMLNSIMPRSGGDYVFASRIFSPVVGFALSVILVFYLFFGTLGFTSGVFTVPYEAAPLLSIIGSISGNSGLVSFASTLSQPEQIIIIGLFLLAITLLICIQRPRVLRNIMLGLFAIGFAGYPVIYTIGMAATSNAHFAATLNSYALTQGWNTTYSAFASQAIAAGASLPPITLLASITAIPLIMISLQVPNFAAYVSGETKHATRQVPIGMLAPIFIIAAVTVVMAYFTYNVFGYNFIGAASYFAFSGAAGNPFPVAPSPGLFFGILYPNTALLWFMLISALAYDILLLIASVLVATRTFFAWSFDRLGPKFFSDVSERFHTPVKATIIAVLGGVLFLVLIAYNVTGVLFTVTPAFVSAYLLAMIGAVVFPFIKRDIFNQAPSYARKKIGGLPVISVIASISVVAIGTIFYYLLLDPDVSGVSGPGSIAVITVYLVAAVIYFGMKALRKRQGYDLALVYKEIPPE